MRSGVSEELVAAALAAARERRTEVASVPVTAIAAAAGISRSTLLRRLGGSRKALDEAVRAAGVDPGGRASVRERAIAATAELIGQRGLGALTLEAVAEAAGCALPSLHTVFGGRDGLLLAVFERHGPIGELERLAAAPPESLEQTVGEIHRALMAAFERQPRILPALLADVFARPQGPGNQMFQAGFPRMFAAFSALLEPHLRSGRLRELPIALIIQQMLGPLALHLALRPALTTQLGARLPSLEQSREVFADAFVRALTPHPRPEGDEHA